MFKTQLNTQLTTQLLLANFLPSVQLRTVPTAGLPSCPCGPRRISHIGEMHNVYGELEDTGFGAIMGVRQYGFRAGERAKVKRKRYWEDATAIVGQ